MRHALVLMVVLFATACSSGSDSPPVATTAASSSPAAEPEDFNEQWCDAVLPFKDVLDEIPTLNRDPQLVAAAEEVESDLNRLSDDLDAAGLDDLAGQVGALSIAIGDLADVLDTEYDSAADALKHAVEDQGDVMDEVNAAMKPFSSRTFGTC